MRIGFASGQVGSYFKLLAEILKQINGIESMIIDSVAISPSAVTLSKARVQDLLYRLDSEFRENDIKLIF